MEKITRGGNTSFVNRDQERPLTGKVQNQKAAQGEERLARTIEKGISKGIVLYHYFRWTTLKRGTVGYKELDEFVMTTFGPIAISVKGEGIIHQTEAQKNQDKLNELKILTRLRELGYPVREIKSVPAAQLKTQADADRIGRKLGVYR